jgi:hypothetical protein
VIAPRALARRCPPAAWEAYLLVAVFPEGARLRWAKVHAFVGCARPGRRCLSAVEALDGPGELVVLTADEAVVKRHARPLDAATCTRSSEGWTVEAPGLVWSGFPETRVVLEVPRVEVTASVQHVGWWARIPRVLSYFTGFGPLAWKDDSGGVLSGIGLVEHAWGADVPFDVAAWAPRRWQWDVLTCEDGGTFGSLTVAGLGVRTMGRASPREPFGTGHRARCRVASWRHEASRPVPERWTGTLVTPSGRLDYEASATTPVAPTVPDGGFLGTRWTGRLNRRDVGGTGFTEYRARRARSP